MRQLTLALLATAALAGCASNSGVRTTPTFSAARFVPQAPRLDSARPDGPRPVRPRVEDRGPRLQGSRAVASANRSATVVPDSRTMRGGTWFIDQVDETLIYQVALKPNHVTTVLLPPGERFNGAVGGDVDSFLINVAYAGPRPAVSILPRAAAAKGNLQLVTTAGFYSFDLRVNEWVGVNLVDVGREDEQPAPVAGGMPQPQGDFTRLALAEPESRPLPPWAPAEAWADSYKMVVRFNGPLPQLPALFAGQEGEQMVSYRSVRDASGFYLVTDRRVTEAELRLDAERVRLGVDPAAIAAGAAADPALGADSWRGAEALSGNQGGNDVAVVIVPGTNGSQPAGSNIPGGRAPAVVRPALPHAGTI